MNTKELVRRIVDETGHSPDEVNSILDTMTTIIGNALINEEDVRLTAFGTFKNQEWKSRKICNISTGEYVNTKPSHRIVFVPSGELKEAVKL